MIIKRELCLYVVILESMRKCSRMKFVRGVTWTRSNKIATFSKIKLFLMCEKLPNWYRCLSAHMIENRIYIGWLWNWYLKHVRRKSWCEEGLRRWVQVQQSLNSVWYLSLIVHTYKQYSNIVEQCVQIVRDNHLSDTIEVIRGKMEDIELPVEHVDIIISEWMVWIWSTLIVRNKFLLIFVSYDLELIGIFSIVRVDVGHCAVCKG